MQVFLLRHADAVDETLELRDPHRHLSARGRTQARGVGVRLRWHDCDPTHVWTSPFARAVQTAELVTAVLAVDACVEIVPDLGPDGSPPRVAAAVEALPANATVLLVGHEPSLSEIGSLIVGAPSLESLAKAQAARIVDGVLRWRFAWDAEAPATGSRRATRGG